MSRHTLPFLAAVSVLPILLAADAPFPHVLPTPPESAEKTFRTLGGFHMDLLAAEPLVTDPVAMAYDENGRAYVVEMNDYPYTNKSTHQPYKENTTDAPIGKVRLLEDTDGDGKFDKSTIFADQLSWPTGVACWKGGIFITATPDIWYLKDTDGDGKADIRQKVFTGFRKLNVQAVINNLAWGLDNHLYAAGATNGANVVKISNPDAKPIPMLRNDFRFDPQSEDFELLSGGARFGNAFDNWGNRFLCNIRNPAQHVVIEYKYLQRNPYLPVASALADVAESGDALPVYRISPPEAWRELRATRWAGDRTVSMPRSELVAGGVVTSSSGITIYRGSAYPDEFRNQFFIGEVANNLIHRQALSPTGATFTSKRIDDHTELVASTDVWFRPVNFVNAPDGTLHVLDMYREVIEHPWSIPDDIHDRLDLRSGSDRGRIYRLSPPNFIVPAPPRLGSATVAQLVKTLEHPTAWWRETAQRLLVERKPAEAIPLLRATLAKSDSSLGRLHALWTLSGLSALEEPDLLLAMGDQIPAVRENAIRAAEPRLKESAKLRLKLRESADDVNARVRFQAALSIGLIDDPAEIASPVIPAALAKILHRDIADPWAATAVLVSSANCGDQLLARLLADSVFTMQPEAIESLRKLAAVVGLRNRPEELTRLLEALQQDASPQARTATLTGLGEGLRRSRRTLRDLAGPRYRFSIPNELDTAAQRALDPKSPPDQRIAAIRLIACDQFEKVSSILSKLLAPQQPQEIQRAAVAAASAFTQPDIANILLEHWRAYTPALRTDVISALLAQKNRLIPLLDAIESGKIAPTFIPATRRTQLLQHADAQIRERATKLLSPDSAGPATSRKETIEKYRPALDLAADPAAGRKVFESICANCHRLGGIGNDVGPNLATVRSWTSEQLLTNILDPNREVAPSFVEYILELDNGENLSGIITDETAGALTIVQSGGGRQTILRSSVRRLFSSGVSLMPEGLESSLTPQQIADVLAFIRQP